ncbi:MAG TPA: hypothetical protein VHI78_07360 [Bacteroidales bacterium]|nr:hypothetical protein [Bacteroidales bacterium]
MKNSLFVLLALPLFFLACTNKQQAINNKPAYTDSALGFIIADTIIYDVNIVNKNPDDQWSTKRLNKLDRKLMIDNIYDLVYSGKANAYNHTSGEKLTIRQVQELEKSEGFNRENVDMIQFKEVWYMNPEQKSITKKVLSMVLGSQVYGTDGQYLANRAVMRVEF